VLGVVDDETVGEVEGKAVVGGSVKHSAGQIGQVTIGQVGQVPLDTVVLLSFAALVVVVVVVVVVFVVIVVVVVVVVVSSRSCQSWPLQEASGSV
jgi:uncharacterized protein HemY